MSSTAENPSAGRTGSSPYTLASPGMSPRKSRTAGPFSFKSTPPVLIGQIRACRGFRRFPPSVYPDTSVVIPHFYLFAPIVYGLEVLTAVSLILGCFVRLGGVIGALQIANLWLGLYSAPGEWPWTYFFLLLLMASFALHHYGRSLGIDAIIVARATVRGKLGRMILAEAT